MRTVRPSLAMRSRTSFVCRWSASRRLAKAKKAAVSAKIGPLFTCSADSTPLSRQLLYVSTPHAL